MARFSELSATISANTSDFQRGMDSAERSLNGFQREALQAAANANITGEAIEELADDAVQSAAMMRVLSNQTDNVGNQMTQTTIQTAGASTSLTSFGASATGANVSVTLLSTSLTTLLIPALVGVSAALVPVVTALGGLATIGASIAGIGLVGALGAIATHTEELRATFNNLLDVIRNEFAFAFDLFTGVLNSWMDTLSDVIPAMVPARDVLHELAGGFALLGNTLIEALPALTELAVSLTTEFMPGLITLAEDVLPEIPGFLETLVDTFVRLIPSFERAGNLLVDLGPELLDFGFALLSVIGPALETATESLTGFLRVFNNLSGDTSGFVDFVQTGINRLLQWIQGPGLSTVAQVATNILDTLALILGQSDRSQLIAGLVGLVGDGLTGISNWLDGSGQAQITQLLTDFIGAVATGLKSIQGQFESQIQTPILNIIANLFDSVTNALASDEANRLSKAFVALGQSAMASLGDSLVNYVNSSAFREDIVQLGAALGNTVVVALSSANDRWKAFLIDAFTNQIPGIILGGWIKIAGMLAGALQPIENQILTTFTGIANTVSSIMTNMVNNAVIDPINNSISRIQNLIGMLPSSVLGQIPQEFQQLGQVEDVSAPTIQRPESQIASPSMVRSQAIEEIGATLDINIQGDGQLAQIIRETADIQIQQQARRADRTRQRGDGT